MDISQSNWNENDNSNATAAPDGAPEGMPPSGVNDTLRAVMGAIKRWYDQLVPATTTGSSTAYVLGYAVVPTALADGMTFLVRFHAACGAAPTLNVNSLGAKPLHKFASGAWAALAAGDIAASQILRLAYDAGSGTLRVLSAPGTAAQYNVGTAAGNVVQLDGAAKLPAVDGSQLTGLAAWFSTGDLKLTLRTAADAGWVLCNDGTIGNAASGATARADADTQALFTLLWTNMANALCPVSGGRGASAAADFAAGKTIGLTRMLGRALVVAGAGSGLTNRTLGATAGAETHNHGGATGNESSDGLSFANGGQSAPSIPHQHNINTDSSMPPSAFINAMLKL